MTYSEANPALAEIGERVRQARERIGVTQDELATRIGCSRTVVTNVEKGKQGLSQTTMLGFSRELGIAIADLVPMADAHPKDREPPEEPEIEEPSGRTLRHQRYIIAVARCHGCGAAIERDGSFVKDEWRYWCITCWDGRRSVGTTQTDG